MLDVGFSELLVFGIIALLVLGPEKLPEAARFAAKWYSKFKRAISSVQNDIDRELRLSEFREQMQQETSVASQEQKKLVIYQKLSINMPPIYTTKNWLERQNAMRPTLRIVPIETNTPELKVAV